MHDILIIGASRGIGLGLVDVYLQRGARVFAVARKLERATGLHALKDTAGEALQLIAGDLNDPDCAAIIISALGRQRIDRLILNADISGPQQQDVTAINAEQTAQLFLTNAIAPLCLAKALAKHMQNSGVVAFMSS